MLVVSTVSCVSNKLLLFFMSCIFFIGSLYSIFRFHVAALRANLKMAESCRFCRIQSSDVALVFQVKPLWVRNLHQLFSVGVRILDWVIVFRHMVVIISQKCFRTGFDTDSNELADPDPGDGWLSWQRTSMLRQLSGFESRHLPKIQNGRSKQSGGQHTSPPKKISKKIFCHKKGEKINICLMSFLLGLRLPLEPECPLEGVFGSEFSNPDPKP